MSKSTQQGFSALLIVIIICALATFGFVSYKVWEANQQRSQGNQSNDTTQAQIENQQPIDPNQGYLVIKEWGVRVGLNNTTEGMYYYKLYDSDSFVGLSTPRLDELSRLHPDCKDARGSVGIRRVQPGDEFAGYRLTEEDLAKHAVKVGAFYYQTHMAQPCFGNTEVPEIGTIRSAFFEAIKKIEEAKK